MGKVNITIKGVISSTIGNIRRVLGVVDKGATAAVSEKQENAEKEIEATGYTYKSRLDNIRCVPLGPQQTIVCYDQYTGKIV